MRLLPIALLALFVAASLSTAQQKEEPKKTEELKKLTEKDLKLDFSYFENLGLKVKSLTIDHVSSQVVSGKGVEPKIEFKLYKMQLEMVYEKDVSGENLKEIQAAFNTFLGYPATGKGASRLPGEPPAPHKVFYNFYDKNNLPVGSCPGRPTKVEQVSRPSVKDGPGVEKGTVFRVRFDAVNLVGPLENVKTMVVRPIEKGK